MTFSPRARSFLFRQPAGRLEGVRACTHVRRHGLFAALACGVVSSTAPSARADTVAVEADALAYVVGGYSVALRGSLDGGLTLGVGGGSYELPAFLLKSQASYDAARWRATSESIQVLRAGYRFSGPRRDGLSLDLIVLRQLWHLEAQRLGQDTRFRTLGAGVSAGYWLHLGSHAYLYPTAAVTYDRVTSGTTTVGGQSYAVPSLGLAGSVHVGWEL